MKLTSCLSRALTASLLFLALMFLADPAMAAGTLHAAASPWHPDKLAMSIAFGGLVVNRESISTIFLNLKAIFLKAFDGAESQWQQTAMLVPSTGKTNQYDWLNRFPRMRKWLGSKVYKNLKAFTYSVINEDFEATVAVDRNDIEDDNLGIYTPITQDAGFSAKQLPDEIVSDLKNNAFTSLCYDGPFFYDTDHPVGDGATIPEASVSNKLTGALKADTLANLEASFGAAIVAIQTMTDDEGRPLGLVPDTLEVPPALEATAKLCVAPMLAGLQPNPYAGKCQVLMNPRLTSATAWFVHCTKRPVKPFIYQERKAPIFVQQITEESSDVFDKKEFKFGAEARAAGGYGLWQMSVGSTGTT